VSTRVLRILAFQIVIAVRPKPASHNGQP